VHLCWISFFLLWLHFKGFLKWSFVRKKYYESYKASTLTPYSQFEFVTPNSINDSLWSLKWQSWKETWYVRVRNKILQKRMTTSFVPHLCHSKKPENALHLIHLGSSRLNWRIQKFIANCRHDSHQIMVSVEWGASKEDDDYLWPHILGLI